MSTTPRDPPRPAVRRRWRWLGLALVMLAGVAAAGWVGLARPWSAPAPPVVPPDGLEPAVAAAIQQATEEVRQSPRSAAAWGKLGTLLRAYRFFPEAETCLARAEQLDPTDPRWPYHQGAIRAVDDLEAALPKWQRALQLGGDHRDAIRLRLASALLELGRSEEAQAQYDELLKQHPADPQAHLGLARLAAERGDWPDSLAHLRYAANSPATRKAAATLSATVHQRRGDPAAAQQAARQAAELPDDAAEGAPFADELERLRVDKRARLSRAEQEFHRGRTQEAVAAMLQLLREDPDFDLAWRALGLAYFGLGNDDGAERAFQELVRLRPDAADGYQYLGSVALNRGRLDRAAENLERAIALKPDYALAYVNLGLCRKARSDRAGAAQAWRAALNIRPNLGDAHRLLGESLAQDGRTAEARAHLRQAVEADPSDKAARDLLKKLDAPPPSAPSPPSEPDA